MISFQVFTTLASLTPILAQIVISNHFILSVNCWQVLMGTIPTVGQEGSMTFFNDGQGRKSKRNIFDLQMKDCIWELSIVGVVLASLGSWLMVVRSVGDKSLSRTSSPWSLLEWNSIKLLERKGLCCRSMWGTVNLLSVVRCMRL